MNKDIQKLAIIGVVLVGALIAAATYYQRTQAAEQQAALHEILNSSSASLTRAHSPTLGPENASVTVVEFLDPECESCRTMHPLVKQLLKEYDGRVRYVLRYMPLHHNSVYAAGALEAAREQGRYWEMLDLLFERQPVWGSHRAPRPDLIPGYAKELGLDMAAFENFMNRGSYRTKVQIDRQDGTALGVTGTPTFFVNGERLAGLSYDSLRSSVATKLR